MNSDLLTIEDSILDSAFEIFHEMADDNLDFNDLEKYQQDFDEQGAAIAILPADDWQAHLDFELDKNLYVEIQIGLAPKEEMEVLLARLLLSRDPKQKFCHILWKR